MYAIRSYYEYYPFRYVDRSKIFKVNEIESDLAYVQLRGKIFNMQVIGEKRGRRLTAMLRDETGEIELVWFQGIKWIKESIEPNTEYVVFGKPGIFNRRYNIPHPELEPATEFDRTISGTLHRITSYNVCYTKLLRSLLF